MVKEFAITGMGPDIMVSGFMTITMEKVYLFHLLTKHSMANGN